MALDGGDTQRLRTDKISSTYFWPFPLFFVAQTRKSRTALAWDDLMPSHFSMLLKEGQASKAMAFASGGRGRGFIFRCFIFRNRD